MLLFDGCGDPKRDHEAGILVMRLWYASYNLHNDGENFVPY
jgi:hypothetical protein